MKDDLITIANTPKIFTINGKDYKVKQFNLFKLSEIRKFTIDNLRKQYKLDVSELATSIDVKERSKFILDAIKSQNISEDSIRDFMMSKEGIIKILGIALKEKEDKILELTNRDDLQDIILEVFKYVLGIQEVNDTTGNTDTTETAEKKI